MEYFPFSDSSERPKAKKRKKERKKEEKLLWNYTKYNKKSGLNVLKSLIRIPFAFLALSNLGMWKKSLLPY